MRTGISRRFILTVSIVFSACVILLSLLFVILLESNARAVRGFLLNGRVHLLTEKFSSVRDTLERKKPATPKHLSRAIVELFGGKNDVLYALVFSATADDNFFRAEEVIGLSGTFPLGLERGTVVREEGYVNYLKKGRLELTVDPRLRLNDGVYWQSVYLPVAVGKRNCVAGFLVSASSLQASLKEYGAHLKKIKYFIVLTSLLLVLVVMAAGVIFLNNFTLLINRLSSSIDRVARGELDVNLNPETDAELSSLALSFNSLVGELKERKEKEKTTAAAETKDPWDDIFKTGVTLLREERLEEAMAVFLTLTLLNPSGFGGFFNLGVACAKSRKFERARGAFARALELNPEHELTGQYLEKAEKLHAKYGKEPSRNPSTDSAHTG